jgi:hypothetical protein
MKKKQGSTVRYLVACAHRGEVELFPSTDHPLMLSRYNEARTVAKVAAHIRGDADLEWFIGASSGWRYARAGGWCFMIVGAAEGDAQWAIDIMLTRHMAPCALRLFWDTAKGDYAVVATDKDMTDLYQHFLAEVGDATVAEAKAAATALP